MSLHEQYLQNLEALQANNSVIRPLVETMDEVLAREPAFGFEGRAEGAWHQTAGPPEPVFAQSAQTATGEFLRNVDHMQIRHALAHHSFQNRRQSYDRATYVMTGRPSDHGAVFVRRCGVVGLRGATEHSTADQYRIEVPTRETVYTFMLSRLGGVAVQAEDHRRPTQNMKFAKSCFMAFPDKAAVESLLTGNFASEQDITRLLARLNAAPEQEPLKAVLRDHAQSIKAGTTFAERFNLYMPDREQIVGWRTAVERLFGS